MDGLPSPLIAIPNPLHFNAALVKVYICTLMISAIKVALTCIIITTKNYQNKVAAKIFIIHAKGSQNVNNCKKEANCM